MHKNKEFYKFLESLKGRGQDSLIESVKKGFKICIESIADEAEDDIANYILAKMPEDIKILKRLAMWSLYYGPSIEGQKDEDKWPGWPKAVDQIRNWSDDNIYDLWYDQETGSISESEPEGEKDEETGEWIEPMWESYIHYDGKDVKKAVFGELAEYV